MPVSAGILFFAPIRTVRSRSGPGKSPSNMALLHPASHFRIRLMNAPIKYLTLTLFSTTALFLFGACAKKDDSAPAAAEEVAEAAEESTEAEASSSDSLMGSVTGAAASLTSDDSKKAAEEAAAEAEKQAAAAKAEAEKQAAEVEAAAAQAAQEATEAAEAKAAEAAKEAEAAAMAAQAEAEAAAAEATAQIDELKAQAAEMYAKYADDIGALQANASKLADLIDQNIDSLPEGVAAKYDEFKTLVPEVTSLVDSLKGYQGADLSNIVSKIETDYGQATGLYAEIMKMIPEGISIPAVKMP